MARALAAIRRKLVEGSPSHEIIDDFFEGVTREPAFTIELFCGPRWLQDAIARASEEILDKPTGASTVFLLATPEHDLVHGSVMLDGYMGSAVYFHDLRLGALALFPDDVAGPSHYLRLIIKDESSWARGAPN